MESAGPVLHMARLLSILLQRSDPSYSWGFTVRGGLQDRTPITIDQVKSGTLAAQYLAPGDTILQIEKVDTRLLWHSQVVALISQPNKSLDLLVLKGGGSANATAAPSYNFSSTVGSLDRGRQTKSQYASCDSGSGSSSSSGADTRSRKQNFWERISADSPEICREGFTRLNTGVNSPFKDRLSRLDHWKRCQSEERSNTKFDDKYSSYFSGTEERIDKSSEIGSQSNRTHSVWSPTSTEGLITPSDTWSREVKVGTNEDRQGNTTSWNAINPNGESKSMRSGSVNRAYKRHNSDFSQEYSSSLSSEYAATPISNLTSRELPFDFNEAFMAKPSDFWGEHNRDSQGRIRFRDLTSQNKDLETVWKNANISSKSEFKQSTSISEKSYSSSEGSKSFETYEHVNKTKEIEKSSKIGEGGKEEIVEKTKKNKEYVLANKDDVNGQPKETKKVISDFKVIERVVDGENEFCNKTKERSEEVTNSSTPVNFYDNVQHYGGAANPSVQKAEKCDHTVNRQRELRVIQDRDIKYSKDSDGSSKCFSSLLDQGPNHKRWSSSTPAQEEGCVYQQDAPLLENYFEVDIRSPVEVQVTLASPEGSTRRQSSQISGGGSPIPVSPQGDTQVAPPPPPPPLSCPPAPPPPPPPGIGGSIPAVRLSSEIPDKRRSAYEPPAAIQNAMMTKDKKPFTYTPGGLDLSQLRSPRMARRINRNANAPDLAPSQPRPSPLANQPLPPSAVAAMQPQIAIAVLPQGPAPGVPQLHHVTPGGHPTPNPPPPPPQHKNQPVSPPAQYTPPPPPQTPQPPSPQRVMNRQPSPPPMAVPKLQPQHRHTKSEPQSTPGSIYVPPIESQQTRSQLGSLYIPPLAPQEPSKPQTPPASQLNKAPTPWMTRQSQPVQKEVPPWVNKETVQNTSSQPQQHNQNQQQAQTRIIPIQIEGKEPSQPNTRIIPIQLEGTPSPQPFNQQPNYQQQHQQHQYQQQQQQYQQQQSYEQQANQGRQTPRWMNQQPVYVHNKFNTGSQSPAPSEQNQGDSQPSWRHSQTNGTMQSPGPVQSQSFKVLQKITGTDNDTVDQIDAPYNSQGVPLSQLRKLQLSDDDRALMNKVKAQVDDETYLHNESDPRYRGSAIPSRAFRMLQTMTDGAGDDSDVPRGYSPVQPGQNRLAANRTPQPDAPQQYVPPSEQQVQEPRKYTGGAIPSRSFRMLQAMTAGSESPDRPGESEY